jgi:hypothetical protein
MSGPKALQLLRDVEAHLQQDPKQLERFREIADEFKADHSSAETLYPEVLMLVDQNPELYCALQQLPTTGCDLVLALIQSIEHHLRATPDLVPRFSFLLTLFVDELVPASFVDYAAQQLTATLMSDHRRDILAHVERLLAHARAAPDADFLRALRRRMAGDADIDAALVPCDAAPRAQCQLLVMAAFACAPRQVEALLHALDLYAYGLVPIDGAFFWIRALDPLVAKCFEEAADACANGAFFPSLIFEKMRKDFAPATVRWMLGDAVHRMLAAWPQNHQHTLLQMAAKARTDVRREQDAPLIGLLVAELHAARVFRALLALNAAVLAGDPAPAVPDDAARLVLGPDAHAQRDDLFCAVFVQRALAKGRQAHLREAELRDEQMAPLPRDSADWRYFYRKRVRRQFVLRALLFAGFACEFAQSLAPANALCQIVATKMRAGELFRRFREFVDAPHVAQLEKHAALAVFYYCEIAQMVEETPSTLNDIPRLIVEGQVPLTGFEGCAIANVDVVLKYFIRHLRKAWDAVPQQFASDSTDCRPGEFVYIVKIDVSSITIRGELNGVKVL